MNWRLIVFPLAIGVLGVDNASALQISLKDRFKLRQSVVDKNVVEKPAQIQILFPRNAPTSYAVDAGLTVNVISSNSSLVSRLQLGPSFELHRNNQTDKPQATFVGGATALYFLGNHVNQGTLAYKTDKIKHTSTWQASGKYTPLVPRLADGLIRGPDWLKFVWQPTVGLEYDNIVKTQQSRPTGTTYRGYASVDTGVYPAAVKLDEKLIWATSYSYWKDLSESSALDDAHDRHQLLKSSLTMYIDSMKHVGVGFDYVRGEDPSKGLASQTYGLLSLKIKF